MTVRYVGAGGSDANSGLSWADRKLTINGVEDTPVAAGDTVHVGPGVYREMLTVGVSGSAGNPITYIGDVTGINTDGIGGLVRITGSDNDQTATRANAVTCASARIYRTFKGFTFDTTTGTTFNPNAANCTNWIIEDCTFQICGSHYLTVNTLGCTNWEFRRCFFFPNHSAAYGLSFSTGGVSNTDDTNIYIENCVFLGLNRAINLNRHGNMYIRNNLFLSCSGFAIRNGASLTAGQKIYIYNNCITGCSVGISMTVSTEVDENYNTFYGNATDRQNVNTGANSLTRPALYDVPILYSGIKFPWSFGELGKWSTLVRISGTMESSEDYFGKIRPVTSGKKSWGPFQIDEGRRETTTVFSGSASIKLPDAGREQFFVMVSGESTTFSVYCYRESDYSGTNPQLEIFQPGQSKTTVTDAGSASTWNLLSTTITPAGDPEYLIVELISNNIGITGSYATYFDNLSVT